METTKKLTKKEKRTNDLNRHYSALANLAKLCGVTEPDGKKLSVKLWHLEQQAHKLCTDYCNGDNGITTENWDSKITPIENQVQKIQTEIYNDNYRDSGLQTDWGGYGLLSPEICIG